MTTTTASTDFNAISAWTQADYNLLTAALINSMSTIQIQTILHPEWIPATAVAGLDNSHVSAFTPGQFGQLNLTGVPASTMATWNAQTWSGLTATQVSGMSLPQIDSFQHASWLPLAAASGLLPSQVSTLTGNYGQFTAAWLKQLRPETFQALNASRLNSISAATWVQIDNAHLSALTATQVASAINLGSLSSDQYGLLNISGLSVAQIAAWTATQYAGITAAQIATLGRIQYTGLTQTQMMAFTPAQRQALIHPEWLSPDVINDISIAQFQSLTPAQVCQFSAAAVNALDSDRLTAFITAAGAVTADLIADPHIDFSARLINALTLSTLQSLIPGHVSIFNASVTAGLDNAHLRALTAPQVAALAHLNVLSSAQFGQLDISALPLSQIQTLTPTQLSGLTLAQISTLNTAQIGGIIGQLAATGADLSCLPAGWENSISSAALQGLTPYQFTHLNTLTAAQVAALPDLTVFSSAQFGQLNLTAMPASVMGKWEPSTWAGITAAQISTMSLPQIDSFQYAGWLPVAAAAGLLPSQASTLTGNYGEFSAAWLNQLQPDTFRALDSARLNRISADTWAQIDSAHLAALTSTQVASITNLGSLSSAQFGQLNINLLSVSQIAALTQSQCSGLTHAQMTAFTPAQLQALVHPEWLAPGVINDISIAQFNSMTASQFAALSVAQIASLAADKLSALSVDSLKVVGPGLTATQLNMLTPAQREVLPQSASQALVNAQTDSLLKSAMQSVEATDGTLFTFGAIDSVLENFASSLTGSLTAEQFGGLKTYVNSIGNVLGTDSTAYIMMNEMVNGVGGASVDWASPTDGTCTRIGSLKVGSSATELNEQRITWLEGANDPVNSVDIQKPLFAAGGPVLADVNQGGIGDCFFLAAVQEVVNNDPDYIKSMIVQNSNDTYSVRFFDLDKNVHWVNVDGKDYKSGASSDSSKWVSVLERGYLSFISTYNGSDNNYDSIDGGANTYAMRRITGDSIYDEMDANDITETEWNTTVYNTLKSAVHDGYITGIGSDKTTHDALNGKTDFVSDHSMSIIGYDAQTDKFLVSNPWGSTGGGGYNGIFEASMDDFWQGGNIEVRILDTHNGNAALGQLVTAMATTSQPASAASSSVAPQPETLNSNLGVLTVVSH